MAYITPLICAYLVYLYNYRKVNNIKNEIIKIKNTMNDEKFWDKLDALSNRITQLEIRFSKLETKMAIYSSLAVFLSSAIIKFADKIF